MILQIVSDRDFFEACILEGGVFRWVVDEAYPLDDGDQKETLLKLLGCNNNNNTTTTNVLLYEYEDYEKNELAATPLAWDATPRSLKLASWCFLYATGTTTTTTTTLPADPSIIPSTTPSPTSPASPKHLAFEDLQDSSNTSRRMSLGASMSSLTGPGEGRFCRTTGLPLVRPPEKLVHLKDPDYVFICHVEKVVNRLYTKRRVLVVKPHRILLCDADPPGTIKLCLKLGEATGFVQGGSAPSSSLLSSKDESCDLLLRHKKGKPDQHLRFVQDYLDGVEFTAQSVLLRFREVIHEVYSANECVCPWEEAGDVRLVTLGDGGSKRGSVSSTPGSTPRGGGARPPIPATQRVKGNSVPPLSESPAQTAPLAKRRSSSLKAPPLHPPVFEVPEIMLTEEAPSEKDSEVPEKVESKPVEKEKAETVEVPKEEPKKEPKKEPTKEPTERHTKHTQTQVESVSSGTQASLGDGDVSHTEHMSIVAALEAAKAEVVVLNGTVDDMQTALAAATQVQRERTMEREAEQVQTRLHALEEENRRLEATLYSVRYVRKITQNPYSVFPP